MEAILIERDYKGIYERFALTREEFKEDYPELWPVDASEETYVGGSKTLSHLVHIWYASCNIGSILWNEFFTNMKYGMPESDISDGNLAYVRDDLFKSLKGRYDQWKTQKSIIAKRDDLKKVLLVFNFETGDESCKYWQVLTTITGNRRNVAEIEDSFASYCDSDAADDKTYEEMVEEVLDESHLDWSFIGGKIPECDYMHTLWI